MAERKPARRQPTAIDWAKAEADYIADTSLSYADIAERYGVSKTSVERHAREGDQTWAERRHTVGEEVVESAVKSRKEELEEMNDEHLAVFKNVYVIGNKLLEDMVQAGPSGEMMLKPGRTAGELQKAAVAVKVGIEGVRVIAGLPILISKSDTTVGGEVKVTPQKAAKSISKWNRRLKKLNAGAK